MTRLYRRSHVGERCKFFNAHGCWKTTTMINALRVDRVIEQATMLFNSPMNGATFARCVERCPAPLVAPGGVVVMDNLAAHEAGGVEEAIDAAGASV
jgi:hypothetical protein